ncbi:MAG: type II secretion system F family protein [Dehalococcoidia bacterium]|nr:type II secretion system F family protein [Dehalococcoidia bacterium]
MMTQVFTPMGLAVTIGFLVFVIAYMNAPRFLEWLRWQSIGNRDYIIEKLETMFIEATPNQVLGVMIASALVPGLLVFILCLPNLIPGVVFGSAAAVLMWFAPKAVVNNIFQRRVERFNFQMIDGLGLMANGMKSGLSIVQALGMVKNEMPNPLSQEFDYVLKQTQLGVSVEEAFLNLAKRVPSEDVSMFVTAVVILKETGGNLAETFETIVYTIRERIKVHQKISAMMAQNLTQGVIVFCMPFGLMAMFYFSDPEFLKPMFTTPLGWVLFGAALFLQLVGGFLIYKAVQIKV